MASGMALAALLLGASPALAQSSGLRGLGTENEGLAWQAIGRLDAKGAGFCTATLIDPETVITAAHCVYSARTGAVIDPQGMTFRAGLRDGQAAAERAVAQVEAHPGYRPRGGVSAENVRHDVALLRLAEPIPTHVIDPFLVAESDPRTGSVSVVSYGRGRETLPSRQASCNTLGTRDDIVMMDCDVTFGSSGAPVFSHRNGRGRIVSLISSGGNVDGQFYTYGMALPAIVADLRRQMRANSRGPVATIRRVQVGTAGNNSSGGTGAKFVRAPGG
ncbi:trypsin-like serine protease [Sulfitobacter sp. D35]|uniref:trypsin-like serine peptidase n=1 Tax=Sulfitobacter sp. D35 TaxID=3083252 RepID=UPI00296EFCB8|nr:trypsin-like serine protease [Sulfitobacter sp. D35]MDW4498979.1 trypsin-like serine protease [Sulfitobacter sp. D35]